MDGYKVTVEGDYYVLANDSTSQRRIKQYKIHVNLPAMERAKSIIKGHLLEPALRKEDPNYIRFRTHSITNVEPMGNAKAINKTTDIMNRAELAAYAVKNRLQVDTKIYPHIPDLKEAIKQCESAQSQLEKEPKALDHFLKKQEKRRKKFNQDVELSKLNPDLIENPVPDITSKGGSPSQDTDTDTGVKEIKKGPVPEPDPKPAGNSSSEVLDQAPVEEEPEAPKELFRNL